MGFTCTRVAINIQHMHITDMHSLIGLCALSSFCVLLLLLHAFETTHLLGDNEPESTFFFFFREGFHNKNNCSIFIFCNECELDTKVQRSVFK